MTDSNTDIAARLAVEDAVTRLFVATDRRDWPTLEACFTDPFLLDMTSLTGGQPSTMTPRQICDAWAEGFSKLDHVHHQVGNLQTRVAGAEAHVECYGVAWHYRAAAQGGKTRLFVGTYVFDLSHGLAGWQVARLVFQLKFIDGNPSLES